MKARHVLLLLLCLAFPSLSQAGDHLVVYTGREVFGLLPSAPAESFIKRLGTPSAELALSNGRRGLLFGNSLLLVFTEDTLREVRCWALPDFTSDLFLGWMQDIETGDRPRPVFSVDDQLSLGQARGEVAPWLVGLEGTGDERSEVLIKNGSEIWIGYGRAEDYGSGDGDEQRVVSLTVHFNEGR